MLGKTDLSALSTAGLTICVPLNLNQNHCNDKICVFAFRYTKNTPDLYLKHSTCDFFY